jgi:hypothetical protein
MPLADPLELQAAVEARDRQIEELSQRLMGADPSGKKKSGIFR